MNEKSKKLSFLLAKECDVHQCSVIDMDDFEELDCHNEAMFEGLDKNKLG